MTEAHNWVSRSNRLPDNHLRITINTTRPIGALSTLEVAMLAAIYLQDEGLGPVRLIHAGAGSQIFEFATDEKKAAARKSEAEIDVLKADARLKNARARLADMGMVSGYTALIFGALSIAVGIATAEGSLAEHIWAVVAEGAATECRIEAGEACFEILFPDQPKPDHESIDQLKARAGDDTMIDATLEIWLPEDSGPLSIQRVQMPTHHQNSTTSFVGIVVNGDSAMPSIQAEKENFVLHGLNSRLGIEDGTRVGVEAKAGLDGKIYPTKIRILDHTVPHE